MIKNNNSHLCTGGTAIENIIINYFDWRKQHKLSKPRTTISATTDADADSKADPDARGTTTTAHNDSRFDTDTSRLETTEASERAVGLPASEARQSGRRDASSEHFGCGMLKR